MKKPKKSAPLHDLFFKDVYSNPKYSMDLFHLVLSEEEMALFDWLSLRLQANTFVDKTWTEKRTDLMFLVNFKDSDKKAGLLFLLEHKSREEPDTLLQLLNYQTGAYNEFADLAVIPILVYHGRKREWEGALSWQDHLKGFCDKNLKRFFGKNVINFRPRLLNIQALDTKSEAEGLTTRLILYILQKVWEINEGVIAELLKMGQDLPPAEREALIMKAVNYINQHDSRFNVKLITEIEKETIKEKEDRVMERFKSLEEIAEEKGMQRGMQQGMQQGMQRGMQTGRAEGLQAGLQTGIQKGRQQVILNMLQKRLDISLISEVTGLSEEEIKKLQNGSSC